MAQLGYASPPPQPTAPNAHTPATRALRGDGVAVVVQDAARAARGDLRGTILAPGAVLRVVVRAALGARGAAAEHADVASLTPRRRPMRHGGTHESQQRRRNTHTHTNINIHNGRTREHTLTSQKRHTHTYHELRTSQ